MLRLFGRNFILKRKSPELFTRLFTREQNVRFIALSSAQTSSNFQGRNSNTNDSSARDPEKVKRAKLLDVLIVSSIGIIGFGYLIVRRSFSGQVHAKSGEGSTQELKSGAEETLAAGGEGEESQIKKKKRKTLRETRVCLGKPPPSQWREGYTHVSFVEKNRWGNW